MPNAHGAVGAAISDVDRLRRFLKRQRTPQVRSSEEKEVVRATCLAWFNNHRRGLQTVLGDDLLQPVDATYKALLAAADRATARGRYDKYLKGLRSQLAEQRGYAVAPPTIPQSTTDEPPQFDSLVSDPAMRGILVRRWYECARCVSAGAPLAATVMMGGLLETLLLARVHREYNKSRVFQASSSPKDRETGKPLPLNEWTLRHYIDVGHELGWISSTAKDLGEVVRDYRNYIHPHKELAHGVHLREHDAELFWEVSKGITRQLLRSDYAKRTEGA